MRSAAALSRRRASQLALLVTAFAVFAASCTSDRTAGTRSGSRASRERAIRTQPRKALDKTRPSAGCHRPSVAAPAVRDEVHHITIDGIAHSYHLWAPATRPSRLPTALVFVFHGFASDGAGIAKLTRLPTRGLKRGLMVVAPDGPGQTWQFAGNGSDAAFIDDVLASLTTARCVDLRRIYVAGFSAGAAFSIAYACARPDRIAAIATVAVDFQLGCKRPTAILGFHGTDDPLVPYRDGAVGLSLPGVHVRGTMLNMGDWARVGRCASAPEERRISGDVRFALWPRCAEGAEVALYTTEQGGHVWPGASRSTIPSAAATTGLDATGLMLDFFHRHLIR